MGANLLAAGARNSQGKNKIWLPLLNQLSSNSTVQF
jgi:hypothetical protein